MKFTLLFLSALIFLHCSHSAQSEEIRNEESTGVVDPKPENEAGERETYRFAIISDMNGSYGSTSYGSSVKSAIRYIADKKNGVQFALSTGDMVAGQKSNLNYRAMWEAFHSTVTRPLLNSGVVLYPSPGNHDAYISRATERRHYRNSWDSEKVLTQSSNFRFVEGVSQNFPFQYAFRIGSGLFIALDNTDTKPWRDSTVDWLEQVLKKESSAKLKMIYGHVPLLPFAFKKEREYVSRGDARFLKDMEQLFDDYDVDVFFSGHSHVYYPGRRDRKTEFISVPLLGSGSRYIISKKSLPRSQSGFLIIDFDSQGNWSLKHRSAKDYSLISDRSFPEVIQLPSSNSSLCRYCNQFPDSHFLDASKRIIYKRRDIQ